MKNIKIGIIAIASLFGLFAFSFIMRGCSDAANVAHNEFGASALLKKYEWFKDAAYQLEAKSQNIQVYNEKISSMRKDYEGVPRKDWDRTDKDNQAPPGGLYMLVVPSLNIKGGAHYIVLDYRDENYPKIYDPNKGREGKEFYCEKTNKVKAFFTTIEIFKRPEFI